MVRGGVRDGFPASRVLFLEKAMKQFTAGDNDAGLRMDKFIAKVCALPQPMLYKSIRLKKIRINGKRVTDAAYRLSSGDTVEMYISDEFFVSPGGGNAYKLITPSLNIVYEDANILLADKPVGMIVHPDSGESVNTLIAHIQAYLFRKGDWDPESENTFAPALCNRIDRNTGGIVIAAKNAESLRILAEKIKGREIIKQYVCAVHGELKPPEGRLKGYLLKNAVSNRVTISPVLVKGGLMAETVYKTLAVRDGLSLLKCELVTGRTHQIRAQLATMGHPLLGDNKYGAVSQNRPYGERFQTLYSFRVEFAFTGDAGVLNYLRGRVFSVKDIWFLKRFGYTADMLM